MSNLTLPAENKIENICFWEELSKDGINCSFDQFKEQMINIMSIPVEKYGLLNMYLN